MSNPTADDHDPRYRLLLYHKQSTSARTRFLRMEHGITAFQPLPPLSQVIEREVGAADDQDKVRLHPAAIIARAEQALNLPRGGLEAQGSFRILVETPAGNVQIFLARFTAVDPPFAEVEALAGRFIDLTQARGLAPAEMDLLRSAYEYIMG